MAHQLAADASIVHFNVFESAVINILGSNKALLTSTEKINVIQLKHPATPSQSTSATNNETRNPWNYNKTLDAKRQRLSEAATTFLECHFVAENSSPVKRSFSTAQHRRS